MSVIRTTEPTLEELIKMRHASAILVRRFGDKYLPFFERFDLEVTTRENKLNAIERAISIGSEQS